eukprot:3309646-Pleurochrysis_carterae.AAC.1
MMHDQPRQFLGINIDLSNDGSVKVSHQRQPTLNKRRSSICRNQSPNNPVSKRLDAPACERLRDRRSQGALRGSCLPEEVPAESRCADICPSLWEAGRSIRHWHIPARALTFPAIEMDEHDNRVLAYMADWAVPHSTTGFCVTFKGAAISSGSKRQHCILLSSTEVEIVAVLHTAVPEEWKLVLTTTRPGIYQSTQLHRDVKGSEPSESRCRHALWGTNERNAKKPRNDA